MGQLCCSLANITSEQLKHGGQTPRRPDESLPSSTLLSLHHCGILSLSLCLSPCCEWPRKTKQQPETTASFKRSCRKTSDITKEERRKTEMSRKPGAFHPPYFSLSLFLSLSLSLSLYIFCSLLHDLRDALSVIMPSGFEKLLLLACCGLVSGGRDKTCNLISKQLHKNQTEHHVSLMDYSLST